MICPLGWDLAVTRQLNLVQVKLTQDDYKNTNGEETYREKRVYNKGRGKEATYWLK